MKTKCHSGHHHARPPRHHESRHDERHEFEPQFGHGPGSRGPWMSMVSHRQFGPPPEHRRGPRDDRPGDRGPSDRGGRRPSIEERLDRLAAELEELRREMRRQ